MQTLSPPRAAKFATALRAASALLARLRALGLAATREARSLSRDAESRIVGHPSSYFVFDAAAAPYRSPVRQRPPMARARLVSSSRRRCPSPLATPHECLMPAKACVARAEAQGLPCDGPPRTSRRAAPAARPAAAAIAPDCRRHRRGSPRTHSGARRCFGGPESTRIGPRPAKALLGRHAPRIGAPRSRRCPPLSGFHLVRLEAIPPPGIASGKAREKPAR